MTKKRRIERAVRGILDTAEITALTGELPTGHASAVEIRQVGMDLGKIEWMLEREQIEITDREFLFLAEHTQERLQNGDPD